jgi:hypothetical protein
MSGGHFDYDQYRIGQIADSISHIISTNDSTEKDEYGDDIGYHYSPEIIARFREAVTVLRKAEIMAQRIDWLVSGDDGEESFMRRWDEELGK